MDKPNRNHTIKIKLNGETQSFKEEPVQKKFNSPKELEVENKDQHVFHETAAAQESFDESFDWIIPETAEHDIEEYRIVSSQKSQKPPKGGKKKGISITTISNKRNGGALKSIFLTAVFAILIGTSLGALMLKLVITDGSKPAVVEPVTVNKGTSKDTKETSGKTVSVALGAQTIYIVQGGAFSTIDKAKTAANEAIGKGASGQALTISEKNFMFLAVADSIESAKQLGSLYKTKGFEDPFAKQISITEKTVSDINESEKSFLEAAPAAFQELAKVTTNAMVTSAVSEESSKTVSTVGEQINKNADKLKNEKVKSLQKDLKGAVEKVNEYKSSKSAKSLMEAQQHLLNYLTIYYSL